MNISFENAHRGQPCQQNVLVLKIIYCGQLKSDAVLKSPAIANVNQQYLLQYFKWI